MLGRFRKGQYNAFDVINLALLLLFAFVCAYPFWMIIVASFNEGRDYLRGGVYWWPRSFSTANYAFAFRDMRLWLGARVTLGRTVVGTLTHVFFTAMVAYGMSRKDLRFKKVLFNINMVTMFIGGGLIPFYLLLRELKLLNTFWVYIIPGLYSVMNMIIMSNFFREIPEEIHESAVMDGANEFTIFARLYIPMSTPVLATISLWVGVGHWNAYFDSMIYTTDANLQTLNLFLVRMVREAAVLQSQARQYMSPEMLEQMESMVTYETMRFATVVLATIPIFCLYPFVQRFFTKGILLGSLKG